MAKVQTNKGGGGNRGILARPLDALIFLLPFILLFEFVSFTRTPGLVALHMMEQFLRLFGRVAFWAPGIAVVIILLATHAASGEKWKIHWRDVGFMYIEAVLLAIPLFILSWFLPLLGAGGGHSLLERLAMSLGAGIYEELIFRLVLISVVVIIGCDLLKFDRQPVAIIAIGLSSVIFAASHHRPFGLEPLALMPLLFRSLAGAYLAVIFWFRGYGPAAGCHGAYNVLLLFLTKS